MSKERLIEILKQKSALLVSSHCQWKTSNHVDASNYTSRRCPGHSQSAIELLIQKSSVSVSPVTGAIPIGVPLSPREHNNWVVLSVGLWFVRARICTGNMVEGLGSLKTGSKVCMVEDTVTIPAKRSDWLKAAEMLFSVLQLSTEEGAVETNAAYT